ncbi:MAG: hypothetical protein K2M01_06945 [Paramuribaculum sp.]|nr:hypothetical protein [Paramuribaculum sp.]
MIETIQFLLNAGLTLRMALAKAYIDFPEDFPEDIRPILESIIIPTNLPKEYLEAKARRFGHLVDEVESKNPSYLKYLTQQ